MEVSSKYLYYYEKKFDFIFYKKSSKKFSYNLLSENLYLDQLHCCVCNILIKNKYDKCSTCKKNICKHSDCRLVLPDIKFVPNELILIIDSYIGIQCYNCVMYKDNNYCILL
jgi:hypothetical protein